MRTLTILITASTGLLLQLSSLSQDAPPAPTPLLEIFSCSFRGNSDMDDFNAAVARFNDWADRNNFTDFTAFTATPFLYSADVDYDMMWIGSWTNGASMAKHETLYLTQGEEIQAAFDAAVDCPSHALYAEVVINQPEAPPPENGAIAVFSDCTVRDGRTVPEAIAAAGEWSEYIAAQGSDPFSALLFGLAGLPNDADYTFKLLEGFESMEAYGRYTDIYTAGGFMRADELFGRLLDCNSARTYLLNRVRLADGS